jgi:hypothetical protein
MYCAVVANFSFTVLSHCPAIPTETFPPSNTCQQHSSLPLAKKKKKPIQTNSMSRTDRKGHPFIHHSRPSSAYRCTFNDQQNSISPFLPGPGTSYTSVQDGKAMSKHVYTQRPPRICCHPRLAVKGLQEREYQGMHGITRTMGVTKCKRDHTALKAIQHAGQPPSCMEAYTPSPCSWVQKHQGQKNPITVHWRVI